MANVNFLTLDVSQATDSKVLNDTVSEPEKERSALFSNLMEQHKEQTHSGKNEKNNGNNEHSSGNTTLQKEESSVKSKTDVALKNSEEKNKTEVVAQEGEFEHEENTNNTRKITEPVTNEKVVAEKFDEKETALSTSTYQSKKAEQINALAESSKSDLLNQHAEELLSFLNAAENTLVPSNNTEDKQVLLTEPPADKSISDKQVTEFAKLITEGAQQKGLDTKGNGADSVEKPITTDAKNKQADDAIASLTKKETAIPSTDKTLIAQSVSEASQTDESALNKEIKKLLGITGKASDIGADKTVENKAEKNQPESILSSTKSASNDEVKKVVNTTMHKGESGDVTTDKAAEKSLQKSTVVGEDKNTKAVALNTTENDIDVELNKQDKEKTLDKEAAKAAISTQSEQINKNNTRENLVKSTETSLSESTKAKVATSQSEHSQLKNTADESTLPKSNAATNTVLSNKAAKPEAIDAPLTNKKVTGEEKSAAAIDAEPVDDLVKSTANKRTLVSQEEHAYTEQSVNKAASSTTSEKTNTNSVLQGNVNKVENSTQVSQQAAVQQMKVQQTAEQLVEQRASSVDKAASDVVQKNNMTADENTRVKENQSIEKNSTTQGAKIIHSGGEKNASQQQQQNNQANEQTTKKYDADVSLKPEAEVDELNVASDTKPFNSGITTKPEVNSLFDTLSQREANRVNQQESRFIQHELSFENVMQNISADAVQTQRNTIIQQAETISIMRKDFNDAVKDKVMVMINQKIQQVDIQLDPPEFGNMQVRVNIQNEQAVVSFVVQNQQAKEALEQNMDKLKHMMAESGVDVGEADVKQQSSQSSMQDQHGESSNGSFEEGEDNLLEQSMSAEQAKMVKASSTGVDYYA